MDALKELVQGIQILALGTKSDGTRPPSVTIVHEPLMQQHAPPVDDGSVKELPQRIVAIESVLRGHPFGSTLAATPVVSVGKEKLTDREWGRSSPLRGNAKTTTVKEQTRKCLENSSLEMLFDRNCHPSPEDENATLDAGWTPALHPPALEGSLWTQCRIVKAPSAPLDWLRLVHSDKHIRMLTKKVLLALWWTFFHRQRMWGPLSFSSLQSSGRAASACRSWRSCLF